MKKYWLDGVDCSLVTPDGELLPRGFELWINKEKQEAKIKVPSDIYGDTELLYEETIDLTLTNIFKATYSDISNTPVCVEDGELIGEER